VLGFATLMAKQEFVCRFNAQESDSPESCSLTQLCQLKRRNLAYF